MPNLKKPLDLDIAPAQMIGGMRVKQHHETRNNNKKPEGEAEDKEQNEMSRDDENLQHIFSLKGQQAQDMYAQTASRRPNVMKNAGNNVRQGFIHPTQPRSMNH